jgi:hypothetical protein
MTIGKTIVLSLIWGAILGFAGIRGGWLLLVPAICAVFMYRAAAARRRAQKG